MRHIKHPGPLAQQRSTVVDVGIEAVSLRLPAGRSLLDALADALADALGDHEACSAVLTLHRGAFHPFSFVMPALSSSPDHAVYFSGRHDPEGEATLAGGCITFGRRGDAPWLHCHALWNEADGRQGCGHVLPNDALISASVEASAWLMRGADFAVLPDAETNFSLFQPVQSGALPAAAQAMPALAVRIAPNEDLCTAIEEICARRGIREAVLRGGVGSLVGAVFDDGRRVDPFVTEVFIERGVVSQGNDGQLRADIDIHLVDHTGPIAQGRLQRGANAVLVTFELIIQPQ